MGEIIDFSRYREELKSRNNSLSTFFKEKGADDELANLAEERGKELFDHLSGLGQYSFPVTLPSSMTAEERQRIAHEIKAGIDDIRDKIQSAVRDLAVRAFIAELKVFQYESRTTLLWMVHQLGRLD